MDAPEPSDQLDPRIRQLVLTWLWKWCGRLTLLGFLLWWIGFAILLLLMRWVGESNLTSVFLLYLPPQLWVLPGLCLWLPLLVFRFRIALLLGVPAAVWVVWGLSYRFATQPEPQAPATRPPHALVVLSNNRGQHGGHSLRPFKNWIQPDLMLFQESSAPAASYLRDPGYAEFSHGQTVGEFTLISRFPILKTEAISRTGATRTYRYGARFEVDWNGTTIAVYNIHFPSPRGTLLAMRGGAFLYGLPLPSSSWKSRGEALSQYWQEHQAHAQDLLARLRAEKLPSVVAGDFNSPHLGQVHQQLTRHLTDTHQAAGSGFGFTFPGQTGNPIAMGEPWLRIDYVFCSPDWQVQAHWTEPDRPSQHRAVAAFLSLSPGK